ncbi:leucine-rich repeat domain-containing protein [Candidatus Palauibacter sp.]|uniref:leucine-rich repeat domain-containing protein n=1 Tax=Candidatus Palauibacter sp. TaxID=3101350 RepID=UPI003B5BEEB3
MKTHHPLLAPAGLGSLGLIAALLLGCGSEDTTGPAPGPRPETPRPTSISITPTTTVLTALGDTVRLRAEVRDQNGRAMAGAAIAWASSDPSVATVNSSGLVTAASNGTLSVTATSGTLSAEASLTVMQTASMVAVSPPADTLVAGDTLRLSAAAFDANGHALAGLEFEWSSSDPSVVRVDDSGLVRSESDGVATVTATTGGAEGSSELTVTSSDRPALVALYEATSGPNWINSGGWLTYAPLGEWHGVDADSMGRVTGLDLAGNGLVGQVPESLGELARMTRLRIGSNALLGRLPQSLTRLSLGEFQYADTQLCAPAEDEFQAWLNAIPTHEGTGVQCAPAWERDVLVAAYRAMGGSDWSRSDNWLTDAALDDWYGVQVDVAGYVVDLRLQENRLSGRIPVELGRLANLERLFLNGNNLSGSIPPELGSLAKLKDVTLWHNSLTGPIPPELGSLVDLERLALLGNRLDGPIPPELGRLANLKQLLLNGNHLSGPIPPELGSLTSLERLELSYNRLRGPIPPELGGLNHLEGLYLNRNNLSGPIPPELGSLASLERLYLNDNSLSGPIPPELGNLANLMFMVAWRNELSGPIPPELGNLVNLEVLSFIDNELAGAIPPELGDLLSLTSLGLNGNTLTGPIPPQLGNLQALEALLLRGNALTGEIPAELGTLANAETLDFRNNELSGPIPPALGSLSALLQLRLDRNALTGSVPLELGNLSVLEELLLDNNDLAGPVPPELSALTGLRELSLTNNRGMAGSLPAGLTDLGRLEEFLAGGTGLCAPSDPGFQTWLQGIRKRRVATCAERDPPAAYLTQTVQSRKFPVPLVAGEKALLRVFPTVERATSARIPPVRARFYLDGQETHVESIPGRSTSIPTEVYEGDLSKSANREIPGSVVQPGLEMVIEIDPDGTLDPGLGVARRIPETGRLAVEVQAMPALDLTLIPFVWSEQPNSSIVVLARNMAADPEDHELFEHVHTLMPIGDLQVTAHGAVLTSTNNALELLRLTTAIRIMEGATGHYKGMMSPPVEGAGGVAHRPGRSSFSQPHPEVLAHELGHNLNLQHAPCGDPSQVDTSFPYPDGSSGAWGYDFRNGSLVHPSTSDLMSYCRPREAISDYHFSNALRFRLSAADSVTLPDRVPPTGALLLWGGVAADGAPFLEPAFVVDAPPAMPRSGGEHRLTGRTDGGDELFSLSFTMPEVADGDGGSSFAFVLPVRPEWEGDLASIMLNGPGGSVTLDAESDLPAAILRNSRTGQIRGILRQPPGTVGTLAEAAAALAPEPGLEVLFSHGIPDAESWRRQEE